MNTKVKRLSRTSIPGDVLSAAVASCRGVRPKSLAAAARHVRSCRWCPEWIRRHMQAQRKSQSEDNWATGYWK